MWRTFLWLVQQGCSRAFIISHEAIGQLCLTPTTLPFSLAILLSSVSHSHPSFPLLFPWSHSGTNSAQHWQRYVKTMSRFAITECFKDWELCVFYNHLLPVMETLSLVDTAPSLAVTAPPSCIKWNSTFTLKCCCISNTSHWRRTRIKF